MKNKQLTITSIGTSIALIITAFCSLTFLKP